MTSILLPPHDREIQDIQRERDSIGGRRGNAAGGVSIKDPASFADKLSPHASLCQRVVLAVTKASPHATFVMALAMSCPTFFPKCFP